LAVTKVLEIYDRTTGWKYQEQMNNKLSMSLKEYGLVDKTNIQTHCCLQFLSSKISPNSHCWSFPICILFATLKPLFHSSQKPTRKLAARTFIQSQYVKELAERLRVGFCDEWKGDFTD
jgi:hypothetical protein